MAARHHVGVEPAERVVDQQCVGDITARRADVDGDLIDVEGSNLVEGAVATLRESVAAGSMPIVPSMSITAVRSAEQRISIEFFIFVIV